MKATTNRCLKAIRDLADQGAPITSQALRDALGIPDTNRSSALDIAAGWISTLRRWGMLRVVRGAKVQGPRRQLQVYELTDWGKRYKGGKRLKSSLRIASNPRNTPG